MSGNYIEIFCRQAETHLTSLRKGLLILEHNPTRTALLHELLRNAYTLKGSAGMLGLSGISAVTQVMTKQLKRIEQKGDVDASLIRSLVEAVEAIAVMTSALARGAGVDFTVEPLLAKLQCGDHH